MNPSSASPAPTVPAGLALYMALVQFLFVTCWTVYAVFLPKLLVSVGLPAGITPWVLLVDQLVFMGMDVYVGVAADRAQRTLGRLGPLIVGWTVVSCIAFLLLPHAPLLGGAAPAVALVLTLVWTATSSALRAPPWVLLGKYAARPALPWLNTLMLMGLAAGGAASHYLGVVLKNLDPRLPFALASLTLLATTAGIVAVERGLARRPPPPAAPHTPQVLGATHRGYLVGVLLLAIGFQVHLALNSATSFLRFAAASELEWLMPLFWVGFGVAMMPGSALCKRLGALRVMALSAALGSAGAFAAMLAPSLAWLIAAQLVAGGAWGSMLMAMFCASPDFGRSGREGLALGTMFAMLALATLGRIAVVLTGAARNPGLATTLACAPVLLWTVGALVTWAVARRASAEC